MVSRYADAMTKPEVYSCNQSPCYWVQMYPSCSLVEPHRNTELWFQDDAEVLYVGCGNMRGVNDDGQDEGHGYLGRLPSWTPMVVQAEAEAEAAEGF
jgi:hypothetical protein